LRRALLAVALLAVAAPVARGAEGPSTDEVRFTTDMPNTSTGTFATEEFNTRDSNGQLKRLRHSRVEFPAGTTGSNLAADLCTATEQDFQSKGMSACPDSSKLGSGNATVTTTGTPVETPPIELDATAFNEPGVFLIVFSSNGSYVSQQPLKEEDGGRVQEADVKPQCVVPGETDPCPHGEFEPKSLTIDVPARSRTVNGHVYNLTTTPPTCPPGGWTISDVHTFSDGTQDPFINHRPCRAPSGVFRGPPGLVLKVRPRRARVGRRACFHFVTSEPSGSLVGGAKVRFGRTRGTTSNKGTARLCQRPRRRGAHKAVAAKPGFGMASTHVRVR
jgi:hypothetical protein